MLTELAIRALERPEKGARIVYDESLPGFGIRITKNGVKSFVLTHGRRRTRETIGRVGILTLQAARKAAKEKLAEYTLGKQRLAATRWNEAKDEFLEEKKHKRPNTYAAYERHLRYFPFGDTHLAEIAARELQNDLKKIKKPAERYKTFVILRVFIRWCYKKHYLDQNPIDRMQEANPSKSRSRVLTNEELKAVWDAAGEMEDYGRIVRCLMLSGQRKVEISSLAPAMVGADTVTLPDTLTKNKIEHVFPVGPLFLSVLPKTNAPLLFPIFTEDGVKTFSAWSKNKKALDKASGVTGWVLHDLRRTLRTRWADPLGIPEEIAETYINHVSGTRGGIKRVYNRAKYIGQMREAVMKWEALLEKVLAR